MARDLKDELNRAYPASAHAGLGDLIYDLIYALNAHTAALKGLAAKLDLDAGVGGTDYASLWTNVLATVQTLSERAAKGPL